MSHINVSTTIALSQPEASARLGQFLRENAPEAEMIFSLHAPFDISGLNVGLTLQRDVVVRFAPLSDANSAYALTWQPVLEGPFPTLTGTIFVTRSETQEVETILTLDGHYTPPLNVAGDVFDAVIGRRIAEASANDLLNHLSKSLERQGQPTPALV